MKAFVTFLVACIASCVPSVAAAQFSTGEAEILSLSMIWDAAPHNAFTDIVEYDGAFYVTFREASMHGVPPVGSPGGNIRVLRSEDLQTWDSFALMEANPNEDLRDPKLTVTPQGTLLLSSAYAPLDVNMERQSVSWIYDGASWTDRMDVADYDYWLWGLDTHGDSIYGIAYGPRGDGLDALHTRLYRSTDGTEFETHVSVLTPESGTNEGAILFRRDGTAVALVRREVDSKNALIGVSDGDYTSWTWKDTGVRIGGPSLIELPDGRLVAGTRRYDGYTRTTLNFVDLEHGTLTEFLTLPSGGDTSYPGFLWHDDALWVSYYSSHEGKAKIYLAEVEFADPNAPRPPMRHVGDADPIDEGWNAFNGGAPIAFNGPVNDDGVPSWRIEDDSSASGAREAYTRSLTASQITEARTYGWRMQGRLRVEKQNDALDSSIELSAYINSQTGYVLWFGSENGNTRICELLGPASSGYRIGRTATLPGLDYHDIEMLFDPASETVDVFADGEEIFSDYEGILLDTYAPLNRILWGANSSAGTGTGYYSYVEFTLFVEGDANHDGYVGSADLDIIRANWGNTVPAGDVSQGDITGDGTVNSADLDIIRAHWGRGVLPSVAAVPEPATGLLLAGMAVAALAVRLRRA